MKFFFKQLFSFRSKVCFQWPTVCVCVVVCVGVRVCAYGCVCVCVSECVCACRFGRVSGRVSGRVHVDTLCMYVYLTCLTPLYLVA